MKPAYLVRWIAAVALAGYAIVVARLTLWPAAAESRTFNLLDRIVTRLTDGRLNWSQTEVLANVALFVPVAFLLAIVLGRTWLAIAMGVLASAAIELAQAKYLPSRVPSLADVEHNGLGALIGALLAWPIAAAIRPRSTRRGPVPREPVGAGSRRY